MEAAAFRRWLGPRLRSSAWKRRPLRRPGGGGGEAPEANPPAFDSDSKPIQMEASTEEEEVGAEG